MPSRLNKAGPITQAARAELSDSRMLESAMELIVERGVTGTNLTEVGLRAGYSRGLATMRFRTKAGLLRRVVRQGRMNWGQRLDAAVGDKTGLGAVHAAINAQEHALQESALEMRAIYAICFQSSHPSAEYHADVAHMLAVQRRDLTNWLRIAREAGEIQRDADPVRVADQVLSAMLGIVYQWILDPTTPVSELHQGIRQWLDEWLGAMSQPRMRPKACVGTSGRD